MDSQINCLNGRAGCELTLCPNTTDYVACPRTWTLLLYDSLSEPTPNDIRFHPVGFVGVMPRFAENPGGSETPYIGIEFVADASGDGVIGGPSTPDDHLHVHGIRMCGVEPDETSCKG